MNFKRIVLTFFIVLGVSACASATTPAPATPAQPTSTSEPPTATPPPSAAVVNGEYITIAEYEAELARFNAAQTSLGNTISETEASQIVLEDLIAQVLLSQAARRENFQVTEADLQLRIDALAAEVGGAEALSAWQSANGYDDASFRAALKRAVESAWMRDNIIAGVPAEVEQVHLRQILTYNEANAQTALDRLNAGEDFATLAAIYDPVTQGELGWVPQGYLLNADADAAVFSLQVGGVSGIMATEAGFHIFKVEDRAVHALSPDARLTVQMKTLQEWLAEARANSDVVLAP